jgi:hypothetical protein
VAGEIDVNGGMTSDPKISTESNRFTYVTIVVTFCAIKSLFISVY